MPIEFSEMLKQYLIDNLRIEFKKSNEYCYGGDYRPMHTVMLFLGDVEISSAYVD